MTKREGKHSRPSLEFEKATLRRRERALADKSSSNIFRTKSLDIADYAFGYTPYS
jgi:hypothetical protein